ncbi:MAG TPA: histidinol dehydrogenase, partial [Burkholderiales bacterium]
MSAVRRYNTRQPDFEARLAELLAFDTAQDPRVDETVAAILADVKARGDAALLEYTQRYDRVSANAVSELAIGTADMQRALDRVPREQRVALETAAERVRVYHEHQRAQSWSYRDADGNELGQQVTPLDRVGIYVPGGKAAYPSSVLMNALPAKVAGVGEIVMVVPTPGGERSDLVLAAAALCGVEHAYTLGGAQAVAALAYGTQTIPAVDKIVGPGNAYVAAAKARVAADCAIDFFAGPSEIAVISSTGKPEWI